MRPARIVGQTHKRADEYHSTLFRDVVNAHDIDDGVRLQIGDGDVPIDRKVLTYGAQQVAATLPSWALRCGHQSYSVWLVTSVGASNRMNLDVDGKPCAAPLPAGSLHTAPPN